MSSAGPGQLHVASDLVLTVGTANVTVVADGQQLVVTTDDAGEVAAQSVHLLPFLPGSRSTRDLIGQAGRLLDEAGLRAQVVGERGTLIELGRGCGSRAGRVLLGSKHAAIGRPAALVPAARGYLGATTVPRRTVASVAGAVATLALASAALRRRSRANRSSSAASAPAPE